MPALWRLSCSVVHRAIKKQDMSEHRPATTAGGIIQGDIRMNGHPKVQATFARVSGYVEQFDVHSPQTTVREALLFSARLRTQGETDEVITAFVDEVMDLVELTSLRDGLVGPLLMLLYDKHGHQPVEASAFRCLPGYIDTVTPFCLYDCC